MSGDSLACPRCGYLLSATAEASESRGESSGACTECGLALDWVVLRETNLDPKWFVESRPAASNMMRWRSSRAITTLVLLLRPWFFWSRVSMAIPLDRRGIAAFLLVVAVSCHLTCASKRIYELAHHGGGSAPPIAPAITSLPSGFPPGPWVGLSSTNPFDYIVAVLVPWVNNSATEFNRTLFPPPTSVMESVWRCAPNIAWSSGLDPRSWSNSSNNALEMPRYQGVFSMNVYRWERSVNASMAPLPLLAPLGILLLPISMRRARVRAMHVVRAVMYSFALWIPMLALSTIFADDVRLGLFRWWYPLDLYHPAAAVLLLTFPFNWALTARYLKLPHAPFIALANTTLALCLTGVLIAFTSGWF